MSDEVESARILVSGADPRHAELEARELRDVLHELDGAQVRFAAAEKSDGAEGAKGAELLTPEVVLVLTTGSFGVAGAAIRAWASVRRSRKVRIEHPDGTVTEFHGGVSGREVRSLREGQGEGPGAGQGSSR
ncbi:hypothetical protein ACIQM4_00690 [Streptomyces sp. NPDC091272]|uniref:effector-associated constant component EACC1 n=1 Tax=Streptomyces sp. NPDC091272 TaxID=3365981 RepID=UPI0038108006